MSLELLKSRYNYFGKVALLVLLGNVDGFVNLSFLQASGNQRSKLARLLSSRRVCEDPIDHNADRPSRHDGQDDDDRLGDDTRLIPHGSQVEANFSLEKCNRKQIQLKEKHLR